MAFLCPVRIRRGKKKKVGSSNDIEKDVVRAPGMGRITGSASIETLVRVGIEKENGLSPDSKMVVLHDFTPCVDDELEVKRGQVVNILYRENDWVYVIAAESRQEGFIPHSYCTPFNSQLGELAMNNHKKKLPRALNTGSHYLRVGLFSSNCRLSVSRENLSLVSEISIQAANSSCSNQNSCRSAKYCRCWSNLDRTTKPYHDEGSSAKALSTLMESDNTLLNFVKLYHISLGQNAHAGGGETSDCESYRKKVDTSAGTQQTQNIASSQASLHSASSSQPEDPSGRFIVLYTFIARDENDVSVERGEFVTVLNREDPDWFWVIRSDGQEGFVPSGFVYPADVIQGHINQMNNQNINTANVSGARNQANQLTPATSDDLRYHGTELVMLYDYKAQAPDDLSVRRGDWIYADLNNQTVDGWLWAYAPKTRKYGFIPKAYARPPAMTSL
uniref:SH3 domain-containing protein n=1 Tax=Rhodnius prolixus TaxID=13249 RepID=T1HH32_RHOPR